MERSLQRINNKIGTPKDLVAIADTLEQIQSVKKLLLETKDPLLTEVVQGMGNHTKLIATLKKCVHEAPPTSVDKGGFVIVG